MNRHLLGFILIPFNKSITNLLLSPFANGLAKIFLDLKYSILSNNIQKYMELYAPTNSQSIICQ